MIRLKLPGKLQLIIILGFFGIFLITCNIYAQDITNSSMKTFLIYKFAQNIQWENEDKIDTFRIGVFGLDESLMSDILLLESVTLKSKPISIVQFTRLNDITRTHILYITNDKNSIIEKISERIAGNNTLLVSDLCPNKYQIMINFLPLVKNKIQFEINKANIINENLSVLPELLLLGGTEIDVAGLYRESQRSLQNVIKQVAFLSDSLRMQNEEIRNRNKEIENQKKLIEEQEYDLLMQQEEINTREKRLAVLLGEVDLQQKNLNSKIKLINDQIKEIERQEMEIENRNKILDQLQNDIDVQKQKIEEQKSDLTVYETVVERQKAVLFVFIIFCILILCLAFFIYRGYKIKKEANQNLEEKNKAINRQKQEIQEKNVELHNRQEEIVAQSEVLKHANEEILTTNEALQRQKQELQFTLENLKLTQDQLIRSEKMATVGQLTAGIAHELNNPINFISGNVKPLSRDVNEIFSILNKYETVIREKDLGNSFRDIESLKKELDYKFLTEEIKDLLKGIGEGAHRSSEIVKGLRSFSRIDEDKFKVADIHDGIDSTLILLHNKIKNRITVRKEYGDLPEIECLPSKLNQVFMNVLTNSIQAIEDKGEIFIETVSSGIGVKIVIRDTGIGMPPEVKEHIFEPFYTTKEVGKGTGLGLSISYGIIEQHNGTIDVISEPGKGTQFIISLPIHQPNNNK